ncbi:MAG: hypothetical protein ACI36W_01285 [Coriobacteriales bacterium]
MPNNPLEQDRTNCDLCDKRCPVEALGCGRGERAYGEHPDEAGQQFEGLAGKLIEAGRIAQIKGAHISAAGKDPSAMFRVMNAEDAAQLEALLDKLLIAWEQAHAARHGHNATGRPHRGEGRRPH